MSDREFDRIARLARRFRGPAPPALGIGDDAAVLPIVAGPLAITVDACVEGVHFRRGWASLDRLARRAVEAAVSDLAAMGADPAAPGGGVLFALELPAALDASSFDAIIEGLALGAEAHDAPVLGGNLTRSASDAITITTTALGVCDRASTRSGAKPGDAVFVTGFVGAARLGLEALLASRAEEPLLRPFVERWLSVRARVREGLALRSIATAAIDASDGLAQDASHLCERSGVAIVLELESLPLAPAHREAAEALSLDPTAVALAGGEEYELIFTAPPQARVSFATRIGFVREGCALFVRDARGERAAHSQGWDHFAPSRDT
ncbi:MAG: thiamine-phosphate kinase [Myxococcales bacterium]|nr:thiamine-phosphate kinase [Myxococcales bacterium]